MGVNWNAVGFTFIVVGIEHGRVVGQIVFANFTASVDLRTSNPFALSVCPTGYYWVRARWT